MKILVNGGAGYIGSFMVRRLLDDGYEVLVADSLERGHESFLDSRSKFIKGNLLDKSFVKDLFSNNQINGVIHFAGYISMAESVENPSIYFENNVFAVLNVLEEMGKNNVKNLIFSSTAGVYGNPIKVPITEEHPKSPTNPYGESKLMVEKILSWFKPLGINYVCLRYFNAAGASLDGLKGEDHSPETHIIPNAIASAINNAGFALYGDDYNTKDGTCVRDYVHVLDLVEAHILALKKLEKEEGGFSYNVGTGNGYSNKEVVEMVKRISGIDFKVNINNRRPGDAEVLVADVSKIKQELGFNPKYSDLETIVKTAWLWHSRNSKLKTKNSKV
ncbi:UDP-glucose 4-epimerase GalE [Candidatus Microgenomates bacterium]|nr:MAG: UDP-glucose 4-epimerase GalE [Candidatus Microgenomates bacterium]